MKSLSHTLKKRRWFLLFLLFLVAVGGGAWALPPGIDWHETFYPATRHVLHGGSPYAIPGFRYPPWAILPIVWLGLFPERLARALYLILSMMGLGYALQRLGASIKTTLAFLLSREFLVECQPLAAFTTYRISFALPPYVLFHSWMGALVALWEDEKAMWIATLGLWLAVLIRAFAIFGG